MSVIKISNLSEDLSKELYEDYYYESKGGTIEFFLNGESVSEIELPPFSTPKQRRVLAKIAGVKDFDDFIIKHLTGCFKASELRIENGITLAKKESCEYKKYLQQK
jgi:hypothetical protein